jgi:hypothetical protein
VMGGDVMGLMGRRRDGVIDEMFPKIDFGYLINIHFD